MTQLKKKRKPFVGENEAEMQRESRHLQHLHRWRWRPLCAWRFDRLDSGLFHQTGEWKWNSPRWECWWPALSVTLDQALGCKLMKAQLGDVTWWRRFSSVIHTRALLCLWGADVSVFFMYFFYLWSSLFCNESVLCIFAQPVVDFIHLPVFL